MWLLLLLLGTALPAECPTTTTSSELTTDIAEAKTAFAAMDVEGFTSAHDAAQDDLRCLAELINPFDAAAFHRMVAMEGFLLEDRAATLRAFSASLTLQPDFVLPERIAPLGHPLREQYEAARLMSLDFEEPIGGIDGTFTYVDGRRATARPLGRPLVLQLLTTTGSVKHSTYLRTADETPGWAAVVEDTAVAVGDEPDLAEPIPMDLPRERGSGFLGTRKARWIATGVAAGTATGLYAGSWGTRAAYNNNPSDGLYYATNSQVVASATVTSVAIGLAASALFAGEKVP